MRLRTPLAVAAALAVMVPTAAQAACPPKPLALRDAKMSVWFTLPQGPFDRCDTGSFLWCGAVQIDVTFAGLSGRQVPPSPYHADIQGTVHVTRTYGCQTPAGKRLAQYDTTVHATEVLATRRDSGIRLDRGGDTATGTTFSFLPDRQPRNCPAGTRAMTYGIVAERPVIKLVSYVSSVPSASYPRSDLRASWTGAAPAPVGAA